MSSIKYQISEDGKQIFSVENGIKTIYVAMKITSYPVDEHGNRIIETVCSISKMYNLSDIIGFNDGNIVLREGAKAIIFE